MAEGVEMTTGAPLDPAAQATLRARKSGSFPVLERTRITNTIHEPLLGLIDSVDARETLQLAVP